MNGKIKRVYADNAATTIYKYPAAVDAFMTAALGNPSSTHEEGRKAAEQLEAARESVANCIGAESGEIYFTSGASESNMIVAKIFGVRGSEAVFSGLEHSSVTNALNECRVRTAARMLVNELGIIDTKSLRRDFAVREFKNSELVCVVLANSETGVIQPVRDVVEITGKRGFVLCDATQAIGKIPVDVRALGVYYLTFSSHKLHAFPGAGVLYIKNGELKPTEYEQENGVRGGTENLPAIRSMAAALRCASHRTQMRQRTERMEELRMKLERELLCIRGTHINGLRAERVPGITSLTIDGVFAENLVSLMDYYGVAVSAGTACSSKNKQHSSTLAAMGKSSEYARSTIRISIDETTTEEEIDRIASTLRTCIAEYRGGEADA